MGLLEQNKVPDSKNFSMLANGACHELATPRLGYFYAYFPSEQFVSLSSYTTRHHKKDAPLLSARKPAQFACLLGCCHLTLSLTLTSRRVAPSIQAAPRRPPAPCFPFQHTTFCPRLSLCWGLPLSPPPHRQLASLPLLT